MQILDRLMSRVQKTETCWIWTGYCKNGRYGSLEVNGKAVQAHIVSHRLFIGPVPDGLVVMHKCDNTKCVNPEHLKVGTLKENMQDCIAKGRFRKPAPYKLTKPGVIKEIKDLYESGLSQAKIAKQFGVSQSRICQILKSC